MTGDPVRTGDGPFAIASIWQLYPNVSFAGCVPSARRLADNHVYPVSRQTDDIA